MKKYTKIYFDTFGYTGNEYIPCELCSRKAVDIHHIDCRGMGGSKYADVIDNLMALCRECHVRYGDKKQHTEWLKHMHKQFMENYGKEY